ncbi:hypothetical protein, partial [Sinomonas sp.]|uniref:hypothetical protein n=1 Tax=Sinomonas sp. TaxID=1914986 RepID=UPI002FDF15E2
MKLAITVAGALGGRQLMTHRGDIIGRATKVLDSSPEAKRLVDQVTGTLAQAARGAAITAAAKGVGSLSQNLQNRAERLKAPKEAAGKAAGTATETAGKATDTAGQTVGSATGLAAAALRKRPKGRKPEEEEPEEEAPEQEAPEGEAEGEEPEDEYAEDEYDEGDEGDE